jgi:hypothetical protein
MFKYIAVYMQLRLICNKLINGIAITTSLTAAISKAKWRQIVAPLFMGNINFKIIGPSEFQDSKAFGVKAKNFSYQFHPFVKAYNLPNLNPLLKKLYPFKVPDAF